MAINAMFNYGSQAEYDAAAKKLMILPDSLYFIMDTNRIYRGTELVTMTNVMYPASVPEADKAESGIMYVVDKLVYIKIDDEMICINHEIAAGAINSLTLFADSTLIKSTDTITKTDDKLLTAKATMNYSLGVAENAAESASADSFVNASFDNTSGIISFDRHADGSVSFDLGLDGLVHDPEFDVTSYKLTIPVYGKEDLVVNLPRCVKSGRYEEYYLLPDGTYGPAIVLVVDAPGTPSGESEIVIPAASLIQLYVGGNSDSISITVSDDKKITGTLRINPAESRIVVDASGIKLDLSDFVMKANPADVDKVAVIDEDGNFLGSKKIVETYGAEADIDDMIPVFGVVASAINAALATVGTKILGTGASDMVILSTEEGIARSSYKIGSDELNIDDPEGLLATENAVINAMAWKTIG